MRESPAKAGRQELIGSGCDALIPANPPKAALQARMAKANRSLGEGRYVHTIPKPAGDSETPQPANRPSGGYRPARKSAKRRSRR